MVPLTDCVSNLCMCGIVSELTGLCVCFFLLRGNLCASACAHFLCVLVSLTLSHIVWGNLCVWDYVRGNLCVWFLSTIRGISRIVWEVTFLPHGSLTFVNRTIALQVLLLQEIRPCMRNSPLPSVISFPKSHPCYNNSDDMWIFHPSYGYLF